MGNDNQRRANPGSAAMKTFRFDPQVGRRIELFGSTNVILFGIARLIAEAQVSCMYIGPGGAVGYHPAATPQLFLVVQGEGWVRGVADEQVPIHSGEAAFWEAGEGHASGSAFGMTAIVIESASIHLAQGSSS
jgi:mannose-6-phosphate isomerase-like protein (cupin superfamily)